MAIPVSMQFGSKINDVSNKQNRNWTLLWENPSPTASFAAQTISLDLSEYDAVFILFGGASSGTVTHYCYPIILIDGLDNYIRFPSYSGSNVRIYTRIVSATVTGVTFSNATRFQQGTSGTTTENAVVAPREIYGIKFG